MQDPIYFCFLSAVKEQYIVLSIRILLPSAKYIFTLNVLGTQLPKTNTSGDNFSQITAQRTQKIKQKESNKMKKYGF